MRNKKKITPSTEVLGRVVL